LLRLLVPPGGGGLGCSYRTYASILHEISRCSPSTCVTISVHTMVGHILGEWAAEPQRSEWLGRWGHPENFSAFAVSEAGTGSDAGSARAEAIPCEGGYRVRGEKMWVTNGMSARWFFTLARISEGPGAGKLIVLMVDGGDPGMERTKISGKMGIRGSETAVASYNDVFAPSAHVLCAPGKGFRVCKSGLDGGRIGIAAQATGIAEACLDEMIAYARQREQFGRPIGSFQAVANMIADSAVELEAAKALVWRASSAVDSGRADRTASSMAKLYASECANRIAYRAVQVHGGTGYVHECRVEQLYRDARITTIYEGTSEMQRLVIARALARA